MNISNKLIYRVFGAVVCFAAPAMSHIAPDEVEKQAAREAYRVNAFNAVDELYDILTTMGDAGKRILDLVIKIDSFPCEHGEHSDVLRRLYDYKNTLERAYEQGAPIDNSVYDEERDQVEVSE